MLQHKANPEEEQNGTTSENQRLRGRSGACGTKKRNRQMRVERQPGLNNDGPCVSCEALNRSNTTKTPCCEFYCQFALKVTSRSSFEGTGSVKDNRIVFLPVS